MIHPLAARAVHTNALAYAKLFQVSAPHTQALIERTLP